MIRYNVKVNDQIYQVDLEKATTTQGAENTESSADICFEAIKAEYDYCVTRAEKLENKVYILLAACAFVFVLLTTQIEKTGELGMPQSRSELLGIIIYVILLVVAVALYEQYADGNMSKEEFIRQRDAYRVQEDERMEQIQRLRTEKDQIFQPVKKDTDNLQAMMNTVGEAGDVMHLSQNVVEAFIDRIEVFNDERVKIHFTFEDVLADHAE